MEVNMFKALVLREVNEGKVESCVETLSETVLQEGDVRHCHAASLRGTKPSAIW
jgi:hypothetical protein